MAVKLLGENRGFLNQTDLTPSSTALTVMCWLRMDTYVASFRYCYLLSNVGDTGPYWWLGTEGTTLEAYVYNGSDASEDTLDVTDAFPSVGVWKHVALVTNGSTHTLYLDGASQGTLTLAMDSPAADVYEWLGSPTGGYGLFSIAHFRRWTAVLTAGEIAAEMASRTAVKTAGLFRAVTLDSIDGTDVSGDGHHFSVIGGAGMESDDGPLPSSSPSTSTSDSGSSSASASSSASPSKGDIVAYAFDGNPQIMLQYSDDGGHTWSEELWISAGVEGVYRWRAIWRRLGKSRDRVWRVDMSDPVPWRILGAIVNVGKGTS